MGGAPEPGDVEHRSLSELGDCYILHEWLLLRAQLERLSEGTQQLVCLLLRERPSATAERGCVHKWGGP